MNPSDKFAEDLGAAVNTALRSGVNPAGIVNGLELAKIQILNAQINAANAMAATKAILPASAVPGPRFTRG